MPKSEEVKTSKARTSALSQQSGILLQMNVPKNAIISFETIFFEIQNCHHCATSSFLIHKSLLTPVLLCVVEE